MTGEPESRVDLERAGQLENHKRKHDVGKHYFGDEKCDQIVEQSRCFVRLEERTNVFSGASRGSGEDGARDERKVIAWEESCEFRKEKRKSIMKFKLERSSTDLDWRLFSSISYHAKRRSGYMFGPLCCSFISRRTLF